MRLEGKVHKGWGHELIFATTDRYCGKIMSFDRAGARFSMHFHADKEEHWYVMSGRFQVLWIDTRDASRREAILYPGSVWHNAPLIPHQLVCLEPGDIMEVSSPDSVEDNHRVEPGDSQQTAQE